MIVRRDGSVRFVQGLLLCLLLAMSGCWLLFEDWGGNVSYEVVEEKVHTQILLDKFAIDTAVRELSSRGIQVRMRFDFTEEFTVTDSLEDYEVAVSFLQGGQVIKRDTFGEGELEKGLVQVKENRTIGIDRRFSFFFPEHSFHALKQGVQDLELLVEGYAIYLKPIYRNVELEDTIIQEIERVDRIRVGGYDVKKHVKFAYTIPPIYEGQLMLTSFALDENSMNPSDMDVRLFGSGYPDVFWSLRCGEMTYFASEVNRNSLQYSGDDTTSAFYFAPTDSISIVVWDWDNVGRHDLITGWWGKPDLLVEKDGEMKNLRFKKMKNMEIRAVLGSKAVN